MTFYNKFYRNLGYLFMVLSLALIVVGIFQNMELIHFSDESPFILAAGLGAPGAALVSGYYREMKKKAEEAKSE